MFVCIIVIRAYFINILQGSVETYLRCGGIYKVFHKKILFFFSLFTQMMINLHKICTIYGVVGYTRCFIKTPFLFSLFTQMMINLHKICTSCSWRNDQNIAI